MKISVVTICLNSETTIENTIKSVINQSHEDVEYVIIDGGSTDNTINLIEKYKEKISIIKSEPDEGIYGAINKGISLASGKIISILHSNDIFYDTETLKNVSKFFEKNTDLKILLGDVVFKKSFNEKKITRYYPSNFFKPWMLRFGFSPPHPTSFITRQTYDNVGLYDVSFKIAGDFEFFIRCFLKKKISYEITNQCYVIMSIGGLSGKNLMSYYRSTLEILKSLKKNKIYSNIFFILLRFPIKVFQFFKKKI